MQKSVSPEHQQAPNESRRLWTKVTAAIKAKDLDAATDAKTEIEDAQREAAREREAKGEQWAPRFFKPTGKGGEWRPAFRCVLALRCSSALSRASCASSQADGRTRCGARSLSQGDKASQREAVRAWIYGSDPEPPTPGSRPSSTPASTATSPLDTSAPTIAAGAGPSSSSDEPSTPFYDAPAASSEQAAAAVPQEPAPAANV